MNEELKAAHAQKADAEFAALVAKFGGKSSIPVADVREVENIERDGGITEPAAPINSTPASPEKPSGAQASAAAPEGEIQIPSRDAPDAQPVEADDFGPSVPSPVAAPSPRFSSSIANEFCDAVFEGRDEAYILGFTEGVFVPSGDREARAAVFARAERENTSLFVPVATLKPEWHDPSTHAKGKVTTPDEAKHVAECPLLWVDADADKYAGSDQDEADLHYEREGMRLSRAIDDYCERNSILPFAKWRSGAGWQAFFKLDRPLPPDEARELVGSLHIAMFGKGEEVRNPNRILRNAGGINWKSGKNGRRPAPCGPLILNKNAVVPVERMREILAGVPSSRQSTGTALQPTASGAWPVDEKKEMAVDWSKAYELFRSPNLSLDALRKRGVDTLTISALQQGDPENRSEGEVSIGRGLLLAGLPPDDAAAVMLEPNYPGMAHTHDLKTKAAKERSIRRALGKAAFRLAGEKRRVRADKVGVPRWKETRDEAGLLPVPTHRNAKIAIEALGITLRYDKFHDKQIVEYDGANSDIKEIASAAYSDNVLHRIRDLIEERFDFDPGEKNILDAAKSLALENGFDPVLDYLAACEANWDGKPRLDAFCSTYLGTPDTAFNREVIRVSLIGSVARARVPGIKFDTITVKESKEGTGKSTFIEVLYGEANFSDQSILDKRDQEVQEQMQGVWGFECAELTGLRRADVDHVKAFASRRVDRARKAYRRVREDCPRRCVLWATTNDHRYLKSQTGNRRFLPISVGEIALAAVRRDRDQIWAEAAVRFSSGESIYMARAFWAEAEKEQEARRERDPWEDVLANIPPQFLHLTDDKQTERVINAEVLQHILKIEPGAQNSSHGRRLASVLTRLGWQKPKGETFRVKEHGVVRGYERPVSAAPVAKKEERDAQNQIPF